MKTRYIKYAILAYALFRFDILGADELETLNSNKLTTSENFVQHVQDYHKLFKTVARTCTPFFSNANDIYVRRTIWVDPDVIDIDDTGGQCAPWAGSRGDACFGPRGRPFLSVPRDAPPGTQWSYVPYIIMPEDCYGPGSKQVFRFEFGLGAAAGDVYPIFYRDSCNAGGKLAFLSNRNLYKVAEAHVQITASPDLSGYPQTKAFSIQPGGSVSLGCTIFQNVSLSYELMFTKFKN